mmetsp:Transcript_19724/g.42713  ORF Transcript_19724/g.42713 Transcript_19724/m.42713 type:complete len:97 (-) Transcript_19724:141-431(-)
MHSSCQTQTGCISRCTRQQTRHNSCPPSANLLVPTTLSIPVNAVAILKRVFNLACSLACTRDVFHQLGIPRLPTQNGLQVLTFIVVPAESSTERYF